MSKISDFNPIISIPAYFKFIEPAVLHPNPTGKSENLTVAGLAKELETRYDILHIFYRKKKEEIKGIIIRNVREGWKYGQNQDITNQQIGTEIRDLYIRFMLAQEHGIKTKASRDSGRESFIDTGAYYSGMMVKVK